MLDELYLLIAHWLPRRACYWVLIRMFGECSRALANKEAGWITVFDICKHWDERK